MIPIIPVIATRLAVAGAVTCLIGKTRPSTLLRVAEDGVLAVGTGTAKRVKRFGRAVHTEYRARQIDAMQRAVEKEAALLRTMSAADRAKLAADEAAIFARVEELRASREGQPLPPKPRRASRAGRSATK